MSNWWFSTSTLAYGADPAVKSNAYDVEKNVNVLNHINIDMYPEFTNTLLCNLAYFALYAPEPVRELARSKLDTYVAWRRSQLYSVIKPLGIAAGVLAVGYILHVGLRRAD
jgi:hypothetical protein